MLETIFPRSILEIIEFEISNGWYPEAETGNREKLNTSPEVELKFKLFEEKEITLRIFELITEADIEWSNSLPNRANEFSTYSTPGGIVISNWKLLNKSILFIETGIEIIEPKLPELEPT